MKLIIKRKRLTVVCKYKKSMGVGFRINYSFVSTMCRNYLCDEDCLSSNSGCGPCDNDCPVWVPLNSRIGLCLCKEFKFNGILL